MLTNRVDLTLNRDFAGNTWMMDDVAGHHYHGESMTPQEYEELCKWESIFGVEQHDNQFKLVFGRNKHSVLLELEATTWNPWGKSSYNLTQCSTTHIPWRITFIERMHGDVDIFSLK